MTASIACLAFGSERSGNGRLKTKRTRKKERTEQKTELEKDNRN
jgi:hypothetical protein